MIKANVILDSLNWKKKIKNPQNYLKKKLKIISKIQQFKRRKQEFSLFIFLLLVSKIVNSCFLFLKVGAFDNFVNLDLI